MSNKFINLKINSSLKAHKIGDIIAVPVDENGNIIDNYWRRRLLDAKIDNCVEIFKEKIAKNKQAKGD